MASSRQLRDRAVDRFWETVPPLWNSVRSHIRAAATANFPQFAESLYQFGNLAGSCFAARQGGPYNGPVLTRLIRALRRFFPPGQKKTNCSARHSRPIMRHTSTNGPARPAFSRRSSVHEGLSRVRRKASSGCRRGRANPGLNYGWSKARGIQSSMRTPQSSC